LKRQGEGSQLVEVVQLVGVFPRIVVDQADSKAGNELNGVLQWTTVGQRGGETSSELPLTMYRLMPSSEAIGLKELRARRQPSQRGDPQRFQVDPSSMTDLVVSQLSESL
jgi:hypothetical protein